ncbi:glycoside hydrolase family protein [Helicobacter cappadocius]|uniref:Lysozyme n=1 Tax=Helicobacter cappadocius TaxID=3063998 RepID=A0AA90TAB0_9HELI|nr:MULTISPECIES: hypothetical protein [unclassified Helicobacter]MDO7253891.1 hypothetical protein [Helicobacter sp. faydin-H75]MDP2539752.1 hypothetical protein [Helicobacter sp. faydin-H76]
MNQIALEFIKKHEGFSSRVYMDTLGNETIGYGRNIKQYPLSETEKREMLLNRGNYSKANALKWLEDHLDEIEKELEPYKWYQKLDDYRKGIILDMAYNMGVPRVLLFKKMILALNSQDFVVASKEMLNSGWAIQTKTRAIKLAEHMKNGEGKVV